MIEASVSLPPLTDESVASSKAEVIPFPLGDGGVAGEDLTARENLNCPSTPSQPFHSAGAIAHGLPDCPLAAHGELVKVTQVAQILGCSVSSVYAMIHAHELAAFKPRGGYRISMSELQRYIDSTKR